MYGCTAMTKVFPLPNESAHTYLIQNIYNRPYVRTSTVQDANGPQIDQISGLDISDIN